MYCRTKIIAAVWLTSILLSCDSSPPEIEQMEWVMVDRADADGEFLGEELMIFLTGRDPDGDADLDMLELEFPSEELYWEIPAEEQVTLSLSGLIWYGYPSLSMPEGMEFIPGNYRLILRDQAGETAEKEFYLEREPRDPVDFQPPELIREQESLRIQDKLDRDWMLLFYREGTFLRNSYIRSNQTWNLPVELLDQDWELYLFYADPRFLTAWKQGPYPSQY